MALTPEQVEELKKQLSEQIQHLPEDQKKAAQQQIDEMSPQALETMLHQQQAQDPAQGQAIFRSIISEEMPSKKIDENKQAIAVLDVKPISQGHSIVIPKNPVTDAKQLPTSAFTLAKKVARRISSKLKAQGTEIQTEFKFGEIIINIIPIYDKSLSINSPRSDASQEDLEELHKKLKAVKRPKVVKIKKLKQSKIIKLKRRVP